MSAKRRLDELLVENGLVENLSKAQALILAGQVRVDGQVISKAGQPIAISAQIECRTEKPYVGRGGFKLQAALDSFGIVVKERICADVGASTGGFTDVLLQAGAKKVFAIDVGYGEIAWKLRQDARVNLMERTNARYLEALPEAVELVVVDVSFISLKLILPQVKKWLLPSGQVVALIKPQFEAPRDKAEGGVVADKETHRQVLAEIMGWAKANNWSIYGLIPSPLEGQSGNREFLVWLGLVAAQVLDIEALIGQVT